MAEPGRYQPRAEHAAPESGNHQVPLGNIYSLTYLHIALLAAKCIEVCHRHKLQKIPCRKQLHVPIQLESKAHRLCKTPKRDPTEHGCPERLLTDTGSSQTLHKLVHN